MTALTWVLLAFSIIGFIFGFWQWMARRRTFQRLDHMLEQSISSGFTEENFDEATVEQERPAAEKKKITLQSLPFVGDASFDPRWTSEALGNVVNNAVKYTPAGGRVTVSAQMLETFCRVDVTDTGPGIPEEEQGGIFNRFYRGALTHSAEGLGLGLYLAREILSLQGGYIKVSSKPGNGSTFSLYLPRKLNRI